MKNVWIWLVAAVIVIGGGYWYLQSGQAPASPTTGTDTTGSQTVPSPSTTPTTAIVTYDGNAFSPSEVTIKKGGTVTFNGPATMWVGSASHPAHTGYDGTARDVHCASGYTGAAPFDQCASGTSYSFTFDKVGTWPYHDHRNSSAFGKIVVVE